MKFINRERELNFLETSWKSGDAQFVVIYGKRRIGKTTLIKEFIKNKPHIYFLSQKISEEENLKMIGEAVGDFFKDQILIERGFSSWKSFFSYISSKSEQKFVLAIDEFPYLCESNKGLTSIFQYHWDQSLSKSKIFLILCGSSIAMMEKEVLGEKSPLYGRRNGQIFLKPFGFYDSIKFFPKQTFEKQLELYSLVGGNPCYLSKLDGNKSALKNIEELFLSPESFFYAEGEFLLHQELREPRNYFSILKAVAMGKTKISEIVNETGFEKSILHKYIFALIDLHIIKKEIPSTEKNPLKSRKGIYTLDDQFLKFWFRYILPNKSKIEAGETKKVLEKIKNSYPLFVSKSYENLLNEIVLKNKNLFFEFKALGRWWDKNEEIDLVGVSEKNEKILLGEAKWSNKLVGIDVLNNLKRKASIVEQETGIRDKIFCLFSKSGFTEEVLNTAKKEKIILFKQDQYLQKI